jgi:hypothetical protein
MGSNTRHLALMRLLCVSITGRLQSAMPRIRSRICCKYCWSSGARTILATVFRSEQHQGTKGALRPATAPCRCEEAFGERSVDLGSVWRTERQPTVFYRRQKAFFENGAATLQQRERTDQSPKRDHFRLGDHPAQNRRHPLQWAA